MTVLYESSAAGVGQHHLWEDEWQRLRVRPRQWWWLEGSIHVCDWSARGRQVRTLIRHRRWHRCARFPTEGDPGDPGSEHEHDWLVTATVPAGSTDRGPHLPHPLDAVVRRVQSLDLLEEETITDGPGHGLAFIRCAVVTGRDEPMCRRSQDAADELDPELIAECIDEPDHFVLGRSACIGDAAIVEKIRIVLSVQSSSDRGGAVEPELFAKVFLQDFAIGTARELVHEKELLRGAHTAQSVVT